MFIVDTDWIWIILLIGAAGYGVYWWYTNNT